ncbi:hypothetical protein C8Q76DRAFT_772245 [Earliella scabrosa]|nr:hypothetical protein C8Q76DRAFT_772245 [Earliella scabrosa]
MRLMVLVTGLGQESRNDLADLRGEEYADTFDNNIHEDLDLVDPEVGHDDNNEWEDVVQPALEHAIRDLLGARATTKQYKDARTWRQRKRNLDTNWNNAIPKLCSAYTQWRYGPATPSCDSEVLPETSEINVLDIYSTATTATITRSERSLVEDLVLHGYLGTSPLFPSLAVSLKTLELLRCLKLFKPSFSMEAFAKLLCYLYHVPYRRHYRTALSDVFDIYLIILRDVKRQVMTVLGRDGRDWRPQNACPACAYQLAGEEPATFDRLVCMDGNNSLKRVATSGGREVADLRVYEDHDYFLPRDYVDGFAGEVKSRQAQKKPVLLPREQEPNNAEVEDDGSEGDPTDGTQAAGPCASHWKAAAADEKKRMWAIYDETGIFASACRHGLILWIADMVRSGELAKYAIAMTDKINNTLPGKKNIGYDIGCEFTATIRNSSIASNFASSGSRFCVPAFHGYSHDYDCQTKFHPNRIVGMGLEDLETMERIFSVSNQLASVIRYASPYRRRALIALFFDHWDAERYASLGQMLYNNYRQALEIITEKTPVLREALQALGLTDTDLAKFTDEERSYIATLPEEDPEDLRGILYVEALQKLAKAREELKDVSGAYYDRVARAAERAEAAKAARAPLTFLTPHNGPTNYDSDLSVTRKLETHRRELQTAVDNREADVIAIEVRFGIEKHWQPMDANYQQALNYIATRNYQRALIKLQTLVVQRLFELHKLNLAQTGYKARTYIAKSLQRRCQAIRTAVKAYNDAAAALTPPRETLDWSAASHYSFLEEFALLKDTRKDVREKPWATPAVREAMRLSQRILRAREEIVNVNRESRRLHTAIRDEEILFASTLEELRSQSNPLEGALREYVLHRRATNARNMAYIEALHTLPGFSGDPTPGHRTGASLPALVRPSQLEHLAAHGSMFAPQEESIDIDLEEDDYTSEEITGLIEYLAGLTT